jgi:hypothetical protein
MTRPHGIADRLGPTVGRWRTEGRIVDDEPRSRAPMARSIDATAEHEGGRMSFQAYLDNIEAKTGLTPRQFIELAHEKGFDAPSVKAGTIVDWLKADHDLGRGHAMALVHVIKKGPTIDAAHVGSGGTHSDESDLLWLDGKATRPRSP